MRPVPAYLFKTLNTGTGHRSHPGHRRVDRACPGNEGGPGPGRELRPSEDELAFYDALECDTLRIIAQELVETVKRKVTIDWTVRENVRTGMRNAVRRVLKKHGHPPDKQAKSTQTALEQAELQAEEWANL